MNAKKLCVFPNDPLLSYYNKGEIKDNYFNPKNIFDEIHCISPIAKDIEVEKVQRLAGNAKLEIHSVGKANVMNYKKKEKNVFQLVESINPNVIRAYNPLIEGWLAARCAKRLQIPFVLSVHTQYDLHRKRFRVSNLKKYLVLKYTEKNIESYVLNAADEIIIVYKIIESYVKKHTNSEPILIPNGVDLSRFKPNTDHTQKNQANSLIISVGNLSRVKNHECLIKAMKYVDADLLIIGDGSLYSRLNQLISQLGLMRRIKIIKSIPNKIMPTYYNKADLFALAYDPEIESLPMPVMEAMACALPIIVPKAGRGYDTGLEGVGVLSKRDPKSFSEKISRLLDNPSEMKVRSERSYKKSKEFDIRNTQDKEADVYYKLIKND